MTPREGGDPTYRIALDGNAREDTEEVSDLIDVAKALLIDGRFVRVTSLAGGPANLLGYGKQKTVGYRISRSIADEGDADEAAIAAGGQFGDAKRVGHSILFPE